MPRKKQPKRERGPRGAGSVYQRKDGRWVGQLYLGVDSLGKPRLWRAYAKTEAEAVAKRDQAKGELLGGKLVVGDKQTVAEFLTAWLEKYKATTRRPNTVRGYASKINTYLIPALGSVPLSKLTAQQVQTFVNDALRQHTRPKKDGGATRPLAPRTVRATYAILHAALETALKWGLVARNVADLIDPPRVPKHEVVPLDEAEAHRLLDALKGDRLEALYTVAMAIGLRQGEALGLQWRDIDFGGRAIRITTALHRQQGEYLLDEIKRPTSRRVIPLPAYAVAALRAHQTRQEAERDGLATWGNVWGLVFTTQVGRPLNGSYVTHAFQRHVARAGLPRQRFYDLRHTCASLLLAMGLHAREIMEILGHSQISLTMETYSHVMKSSLRRGADRMDRFLRTGEIVEEKAEPR
jgi:integrase